VDRAEPAESDERARFRAEVRAFLAANAEPRRDSDPWAVNFHTSEEEARRHFEAVRDWQRKLFEAGLAGLAYPREYGGRGGEAWHQRVFDEEAAAYAIPRGYITSTIAMLAPTLLAHGSEEQRRRYLPRLLSGEDAWCQLFSEPGAGSDLASIACRAVRDGDDFVVDGQKVWNSGAQFSDRGMLLARTNPDAPKHEGITFLLVDMRSPGVEVRPLVQATGASGFNEVFLSGVRVPAADVVGEVDGGWAPARTVLQHESAFIGGGGVPVNVRLVMLARMFGVQDDPVVRQGIARHYSRERVLALMAERVKAAARRRERSPLDPSMLKLFAAESRVLSGDLAAAIAGAHAVVAGEPFQRWLHSEVVGRFAISIGGGTNEVQRNNVAERVLGMPREPDPYHGRPWRETPRS